MVNKKGQLTMIGLIFFFILLVVFVAFLPAINIVIQEAIPNLDDMSVMILNFVPLIIVLVIIASLMVYTRPSY